MAKSLSARELHGREFFLQKTGSLWIYLVSEKMLLRIRSDAEDSQAEECGLSSPEGLDSRIKCAVCVGFMTTWKDFLLNKSYTHTWMTYVPILPNELDFPEILGLRVPLPTLVLNDTDDDLYTVPEMKAADDILKEVYSKGKCSR